MDNTEVPINAQVPSIKIKLRDIFIKAPLYSVHLFVVLLRSIRTLLAYWVFTIASILRERYGERGENSINAAKRAKEWQNFTLERIKRVFFRTINSIKYFRIKKRKKFISRMLHKSVYVTIHVIHVRKSITLQVAIKYTRILINYIQFVYYPHVFLCFVNKTVRHELVLLIIFVPFLPLSLN